MAYKRQNKRVGLADLRKFIELSRIKYNKNFNSAEVGIMPNFSIKVFA